VGPVLSWPFNINSSPTFFSSSPANPPWIIQKLSIGCAAFLVVFLFLSLRETMPGSLPQPTNESNDSYGILF
jgi:hypothetical protein